MLVKENCGYLLSFKNPTNFGTSLASVLSRFSWITRKNVVRQFGMVLRAIGHPHHIVISMNICHTFHQLIVMEVILERSRLQR